MQKIKNFDIELQHAGVFHAIIQEFEQHRLPRILRLKDKLDNGEAVSDVDCDFLFNEIRDACRTMHLTVLYPELQEFCLCMSHFYKEMCDEALANELS